MSPQRVQPAGRENPPHPLDIIIEILPVNQISKQSLPGFNTKSALGKSVPLLHMLHNWVVFIPLWGLMLRLAWQRVMLMWGCHTDPLVLKPSAHSTSSACASATLWDSLNMCQSYMRVCACVCSLLPFTFATILLVRDMDSIFHSAAQESPSLLCGSVNGVWDWSESFDP